MGVCERHLLGVQHGLPVHFLVGLHNSRHACSCHAVTVCLPRDCAHRQARVWVPR